MNLTDDSLNMTDDLTMNVLEPRMEVFYPFFSWPEEPEPIKLDKKMNVKKVFLKKETILRNQHCNAAKDYSYGGNQIHCHTYILEISCFHRLLLRLNQHKHNLLLLLLKHALQKALKDLPLKRQHCQHVGFLGQTI